MSIHNSRQIADVKILLKTGVDGAGIVDIEKTGSQGLVDTYTITLSNGTKYTFTVTNGDGITSIEKTGSKGLVDTFTITFDSGETQTFTVTNGNGIESIEKTKTVGLVDTYTITFTDGTTTTFNVTNGTGGGLNPHVIVTSDTGSTVTLTKGQAVITALETSTGIFETDVPEFGTWQVEATNGGQSMSKSLLVDTVKVYVVDASYFSATITVTFPSGATCSLSASGQPTVYATGSPYTFTVNSAGTYTITATDGTATDTETVVITTSGQSENVVLSFVPDGSTVTPTDDIQTWLHCADIWDKSYTTLTEVLADSTTLSALIADSNAVDYMVRSATWATDICSNQSAMSYIGLNDYCADTLLADSTWLNAICNSTYFESVLNTKVPTMTSNTAPSGVVSASASAKLPYRAFDSNLSTEWASGAYSFPQWIKYKFTNQVRVNKIMILILYNCTCNFVLEASNNDSTYISLLDETVQITKNESQNIVIDNVSKYMYYRLSIKSQSGTGSTSFSIGQISSLQFYGRA